MDKADSRDIVVIGGDWNTQVRKDYERRWEGVLGEHGQEHSSRYAGEMLNWALEHNLLIANSFTWKRTRATWWHPRYGTGHELDYFAMRQADRWHLVSCRSVHPARGTKEEQWTVYTDHVPVELTIRQGHLWTKTQKEVENTSPSL